MIVPGNRPNGISDFAFAFPSVGGPDSWTPERPIKIVGDGLAGVRILQNTQVDWRDLAIIGTLKDF